jgi:ubiquinone/menaquinone biosynthesis C-methylase UbiE
MLKRTLEPEVMDSQEDVDEYESMDHAPANAAFVERLVEIGAYGKMLDIGTGPGDLPILVCERIPDAMVVGVDLAQAMLRRAERNTTRSRYWERIQVLQADAKDLPFPNDTFDTVFSNTILHHIPEPRLFIAEAFRVLKKPHGVLLIRDLFRPPTEERIEKLVEDYAAGGSERQKAMFRASFHAALTLNELTHIVDELGISAQVIQDSDRHVSIQIAKPVAA